MFKSVNLLRLGQGQELLTELRNYCEKKSITSGLILGMIGSFESVTFLKMARRDAKTGSQLKEEHDEYRGRLSILSGQGSLSKYNGERIFHIHMCIKDFQKPEEFIGGHLERAIVRATAEIYIGELSYQLERDFDPQMGISILRTT